MNGLCRSTGCVGRVVIDRVEKGCGVWSGTRGRYGSCCQPCVMAAAVVCPTCQPLTAWPSAFRAWFAGQILPMVLHTATPIIIAGRHCIQLPPHDNNTTRKRDTLFNTSPKESTSQSEGNHATTAGARHHTHKRTRNHHPRSMNTHLPRKCTPEADPASLPSSAPPTGPLSSPRTCTGIGKAGAAAVSEPSAANHSPAQMRPSNGPWRDELILLSRACRMVNSPSTSPQTRSFGIRDLTDVVPR